MITGRTAVAIGLLPLVFALVSPLVGAQAHNPMDDLNQIAAAVQAGTVTPEEGTASVDTLLDKIPPTDVTVSVRKSLAGAAETILTVAGTLAPAESHLQGDALPSGKGVLLTPTPEVVSAGLERLLGTRDRFRNLLASHGLEDILDEVVTRLTVVYPAEKSGSDTLFRLRLDQQAVSRLAPEGGRVRLAVGSFFVEFPSGWLDAPPEAFDPLDPTVHLWLSAAAWASPAASGEPPLPPGVAPAGWRLNGGVKLSGYRDPPAYSGTDVITAGLPAGNSAPGTFVRAYVRAGQVDAAWRYCAEWTLESGLLSVRVPAGNSSIVTTTLDPRVPGLAVADVRLVIDGEVVISAVPPRMVEGRILVPLRVLAEALGLQVTWDGEVGRVGLKRVSGEVTQEVTLDVGGNVALVDGRAVGLDVPALIDGGRTLVPLRFAAEAMGAAVSWDGPRRLVEVKSSD